MGWKDTITTDKTPQASAKGSWRDTIQTAEPEERGLLQDTDFPGKGLVQGTVNALPLAGMVGGGILGAGTGAVAIPGIGAITGEVTGAGLGGAAGAATRDYLNAKLFGQKKSLKDQIIDPLEEGAKGAASEMGGQFLGKGASALAETKAGQAIGEYAGKAGGLLKKGFGKVGELLTGVPEKEIQTYASHADEIKQMAKASDNSVAEAADQMRAKFGENIDATRKQMNDQISSTLKTSKKTVPNENIISSLEEAKGNIDPDLYPEQIAEVDGLIAKVKKISDADGNIPLNRAHNLKGYLQDEATSAYRNPGESSIGTQSAKAAKSGAAKTRELVNSAEPKVASANNKLAELHDIEDDMNLNMIREGKPEAALLSAGTGGNARNALNLQRLGQATGTDMLGGAEKLSAMRTFANPKLGAVDSTGKSVYRLGIGGGAGAAAGGLIGGYPGAVVGGAIGSAATSPAALKVAIDAGLITKKAADGLLKTPQGRAALKQIIGKKILGDQQNGQ